MSSRVNNGRMAADFKSAVIFVQKKPGAMRVLTAILILYTIAFFYFIYSNYLNAVADKTRLSPKLLQSAARVYIIKA